LTTKHIYDYRSYFEKLILHQSFYYQIL